MSTPGSVLLRRCRASWLPMVVALLVVPLAAPAQAASDAFRENLVTASGKAAVEAVPDRAWITLGIEARRAKLQDAKAEVDTRVEAVLALLRELEVEAKHVRATQLDIQPYYVSTAQKRRVLQYYVARQVEVDLRNLELLGSLLERATDAGVNQIGSPQLDSSRRAELEREALAKAVLDARANAEVLVKAAGGRLGAVRNVATQSASVAVPVMALQRAANEAAAATYRTGQLSFSAAVHIEYELLPDAAAAALRSRDQ